MQSGLAGVCQLQLSPLPLFREGFSTRINSLTQNMFNTVKSTLSTLGALALGCVIAGAAVKPASASDCERMNDGTVICVESQSATVDRLGVQDAQGRIEFLGDITCTNTQWILHGYRGYASQATANSYAQAYCAGRGNMFASLPSVLA